MKMKIVFSGREWNEVEPSIEFPTLESLLTDRALCDKTPPKRGNANSRPWARRHYIEVWYGEDMAHLFEVK